MTKADLADRIEALDGPDREIDAEIANLCFERREEYLYGHPDTNVTWGKDGVYQFFSPPAYTASIDAAMMLVPDGMKWSVSTFGRAKATAQVNHRCITANTPALAICAAALRAQEKNHRRA